MVCPQAKTPAVRIEGRPVAHAVRMIRNADPLESKISGINTNVKVIIELCPLEPCIYQKPAEFVAVFEIIHRCLNRIELDRFLNPLKYF